LYGEGVLFRLSGCTLESALAILISPWVRDYTHNTDNDCALGLGSGLLSFLRPADSVKGQQLLPTQLQVYTPHGMP
jgi:hypothetical protein